MSVAKINAKISIMEPVELMSKANFRVALAMLR